MPYSQSGNRDTVVSIENLQDFYTTTLEYYDELFPLDEQAISFILKIRDEQKTATPANMPALTRFLGIGCATGNLENKLSGYGMDITGIDQNAAMIETAKRRMKRGFSTIRFFEMPAIDIRRFLKQGSFNIICCIGNVLPYLSDETLMRKFFHDARALLAPGGKFVVETLNYDGMPLSKPVRLPNLSSVRVNLLQGYMPGEDGQVLLDATLEQGNGKKMILQRTTKLLPVTVAKIELYAREAGFTEINLYSNFAGAPWFKESASTIAVLG
jgi:SAM-dependent methyltransferase